MRLLKLCLMQIIDAIRILFLKNKREVAIRMHGRQLVIASILSEHERRR